MQKQESMEFGPKQGSLFHFCAESNENQLQLQKLGVQASCQFYKNVPFQTTLNHPTSQSTKHRLQIKDQWVLQVDPLTGQLQSKFRCDCLKVFEVLRRQSQSPLRQMIVQGLQLTFLGPKSTVLRLLTLQNDREKLYIFLRVLQTKYILQGGFHNLFKPIRRLSRGLTCNVYSAQNLNDHQNYALKSYSKNSQQNNINRDIVLLKEFRIWNTLNHKNILRLLGVFETESTIYMATQQLYMTLHGFMNKHGFIKRDKVRQALRELLEGINHLHERGIMHRDIKLDNIMLRRQDLSDGKIVPIIVDFGLAEYVNQRPYHFLKCGTPGFTAPQILQIESRQNPGLYNEKCDMFSFGVVAYIMLTKRMPFPGESKEQIIAKNKACEIPYDKTTMDMIGPDGVDFLMKLLDKDPSRRMSAPQAMNHSFLNQQEGRWGSTALMLPQK